MKFLMRGMLVLSLFSVCVAAESVTKRPMTIDDELRMASIGDVALSPSGEHVFYSLTTMNWAKNNYDTSYYMAATDGNGAVEYLRDIKGASFRFSPDGKYLTFIRDAEKNDDDEKEIFAQIFIMSISGGEAQPLTTHRGSIVDYKWRSDSHGLVFVALEMASKAEEKELHLGSDAVFIEEMSDGKDAGRFSNFWSLDLVSRTEARITNEKLIISEFDVSPVGSQLVFIASPNRKTNSPGDAELYLADTAEGTVERLTENKAPESNPLWSPNGKTIAYRAPSDTNHELRSGYFWTMDVATRAVKRLDGQYTGDTGEMFGGETAWSPDSKFLLYSELHGTNTNLYKLNVRTGKSKALTNVKGILGVGGFSDDGKRMAYLYENFTSPSDLYVSSLNGKKAVRITDANPWIRNELQLSDGELLRWQSKGGMEIEGVFYPALNAGPGKVPMILEIHGGPAAATVNRFRADFQILAGQGYAVLGPNARGSSGYGDEVLRGLINEVGDGEFVDLMSGVDYAIRHRNIDPDKLAVRGWSWGGVSASYTITQTDRFKAASIGAMVSNWAAETGPGFNFDVALWYIGGTSWDNPEEWAKRSSITHVKNVTTPSIIFHGGKDQTSSVGQSLMFFTALRDIGKAPVRYIKFPREGHGPREPRHRRVLTIEEMKWFKKYIEDVEWVGPLRPGNSENSVE